MMMQGARLRCHTAKSHRNLARTLVQPLSLSSVVSYVTSRQFALTPAPLVLGMLRKENFYVSHNGPAKYPASKEVTLGQSFTGARRFGIRFPLPLCHPSHASFWIHSPSATQLGKPPRSLAEDGCWAPCWSSWTNRKFKPRIQVYNNLWTKI